MTAEALRAAIVADPDAVENWLVYADYRVEQGDPRGELIILELAIEAGTADDEAIARHRALLRDEDALLSPRLVEHAHHLELYFWRGFIRGATVLGPEDDPPSADVLRALYADPHACLLDYVDFTSHPQLIGTPGGECLRRLEEVPEGRVEEALAAFPNLQELGFRVEAAAGEDIGEIARRIDHPRLRVLDVHGVREALFAGRFSLPALTWLELHNDPLAYFRDGGILHDPPPLLTKLTCPGSAAFLGALRTSRLGGQLRELVTYVDDIDGPGIEDIGRACAALPHVTIHLHTWVESPELRDELLARFARVAPAVKFEINVYSPEEAPPPPPIDPALATTIDEGMRRLADRLRRR